MKKGVKLPKVEQLPSGSYSCRATIKYLVEGELVSKVVRFTGKTEQECIAQYLNAKQNEGKPTDAEDLKKRITLYDSKGEYIEKRKVGGSPSTRRGYYTIQQNAFKGIIQRNIWDITEKEWQTAIDQEKLNGMSAKTIHNRWTFCQAVLKWKGVPIPNVVTPQWKKSKDDTEGNIRFLDDKELAVFCRAIYGGKYELHCYLALNGLRRSEILALDWDKISLTKNQIRVSGAVVPDETNMLVAKDENKNRTSKRTVPILFPRIVELVEQADRAKPFPKFIPQNLYEWINRRCADNGLTEVGIHGLRHTGASYCMYKGVKEPTLMEWFGWSNPDTMRKIYIHMSQNQVDREADKVIKAARKIRLTGAKK